MENSPNAAMRVSQHRVMYAVFIVAGLLLILLALSSYSLWLKNLSASPICHEVHRGAEELLSKTTTVVEREVVECDAEGNQDNTPGILVRATMKPHASVNDVISVVSQLQNIVEQYPASGDERWENSIDARIIWEVNSTPYSFQALLREGKALPVCLEALTSLDVYGGKGAVARVNAKCAYDDIYEPSDDAKQLPLNMVLLERTDTEGFPHDPILERTVIPEPFGLYEALSFGVWHVKVDVSRALSVPEIPYEELFASVVPNQWYNVDGEGKEVPVEVLIAPERTVTSPSGEAAFGITFENLNGAEPGSASEVEERIERFLQDHPGFTSVTFCRRSKASLMGVPRWTCNKKVLN